MTVVFYVHYAVHVEAGTSTASGEGKRGALREFVRPKSGSSNPRDRRNRAGRFFLMLALAVDWPSFVHSPDGFTGDCTHFVGEAVRVPAVCFCRERVGTGVSLLLFDHDTVIWRTGHPKVYIKVTSPCHLVRDCHLRASASASASARSHDVSGDAERWLSWSVSSEETRVSHSPSSLPCLPSASLQRSIPEGCNRVS